MKKIPPLFIHPGSNDDDYKAALLTLDKITFQANKDMKFRLYPMQHMFYKLQVTCVDNLEAKTSLAPFTSPILARSKVERDFFQHADIGCEFHLKELASSGCCLSKVKRWCYTIAMYCLDDNVDQKIEGRHIPEKTESQKAEEIQSSVCGDKEWEDSFSASFKSLKFGRSSASASISDLTKHSDTSSVCGSNSEIDGETTVPESDISLSSEPRRVLPTIRGGESVRGALSLRGASSLSRRGRNFQ